MKVELVKIRLGAKACFFSIKVEGGEKTLFQHFIEENQKKYRKEVEFLRDRIMVMLNSTGANIQFFKPYEGRKEDNICALFDEPHIKLRLYCLRHNDKTVILGGGGFKPWKLGAFQNDPKLKDENYLMRAVSEAFYKAIDDGYIEIESDGDIICDDDPLILEIKHGSKKK